VEQSGDSFERNIDEIALSTLRDTVERVYSLNSFYKGKFDELGIKPGDIKELKDVEKLPFTTKRVLERHSPLPPLNLSFAHE